MVSNNTIILFKMKNRFLSIFFSLLIGLGLSYSTTYAQKCNVITADDQDGDGISDRSGQDQCPTTLSQIQGQRATVINALTGELVVVRLPKDLSNYLCQDRVPIDRAKIEVNKKMNEVRREIKRIEEKKGKYEKMSNSERKAAAAEQEQKLEEFKLEMDELNERLRKVNPASYVEFVSNLLDEKGNVLKEGIPFKIYIQVDSFGCLPDGDGDGSPDIVDLCPGEKGTIAAAGCPDRDKDGIPDKEDKCPDNPGPLESQGCPDRDGDGIPDFDDLCPDNPGPKESQGCPDRDKDGIPDKDDACPDDPGPKETKGCPDRDGDGVLDKDDDCPDVPGPKENKGCPKILEKASKVEFKVNEDIILETWYTTLNELAALLKEYPDSYISLAGHTDSDGDDDKNLDLSIRRAAAVKRYLVERGIDEERISSTGYGESKPIASNATTAGKALNRRVEMKLSNKKQ